MSDLTNCLDEILTDENGNKIDPVCGIEKLLELLVAETENQDNITIDNTVIGENISIKNSTDNKINSLTIYGKATQDGTPTPQNPQEIEVSGESYNLLENTATSQAVNGVTFTVNEDKSVTLNGNKEAEAVSFILNKRIDLIKGETYIVTRGLSSNNSYPMITSDIKKADGTTINDGFKTAGANVFKCEEDGCYVSNVRLWLGRTAETYNNVTIYPMIRKASVKNNRYMPYGVDRVEVKSVGKNLFKNTFTSRVYGGITFVVKDDGSIEGNGTCSEAGITTPIGDFKLPKGKYIISGSNVDNSGLYLKLRYAETDTLIQNIFKDAVFEVDDETVIYRLSLSAVSNMTLNSSNNKLYPMIRLATDTDDTYEPYKETLSTIPTENGLAGIPVSSGGNYTDSNGQQWICDEIVKYADGSGKKIQRVVTDTFTGQTNEDWIKQQGDFSRFQTKNFKSTPSNKEVLCNKYVNNNSSANTMPNNTCKISDYLYIVDNRFSTLEEFLADLAINPLKVMYRLSEPIITDLSAEEIAEIEKLSTFYPVTNIFSEAYCKINYIYNNSLSSQTPLSIVSREIKNTDNLITVLRKIIDRLDDSKIITKVLPVGSTEITLQDSRIDDNSILSIYTSDYGVNPKEIIVSTGSVTVSFNSQEEDLTVGIKIEN